MALQSFDLHQGLVLQVYLLPPLYPVSIVLDIDELTE